MNRATFCFIVSPSVTANMQKSQREKGYCKHTHTQSTVVFVSSQLLPVISLLQLFLLLMIIMMMMLAQKTIIAISGV